MSKVNVYICGNGCRHVDTELIRLSWGGTPALRPHRQNHNERCQCGAGFIHRVRVNIPKGYHDAPTAVIESYAKKSPEVAEVLGEMFKRDENLRQFRVEIVKNDLAKELLTLKQHGEAAKLYALDIMQWLNSL